MGRITIFTLDNSPNCVRTKRELEDRQIPFVEISLTKYPQKRVDMLSLSDKVTVPQMFINSAYVGGLTDAKRVLKSWEKAGQTPLEMYESLVAHSSDPSDPRLQPCAGPPVPPKTAPPREMEVIELPVCQEEAKMSSHKLSVLEMTELLKEIIPRKDLKYNFTIYRKSFRGCDLVDGLMKHFLISRDTAVEYAKYLQKEHHILNHVVKEHDFQDTTALYFRLQCDQTPYVLNSYRVWSERVDPDPMSLLRRLKKQLVKILKENTTPDGKVNYKTAAQSKAFPAFEEAACELQGVDFANMSDETKLAFAINLYNLMIKYAFVKVGIGSSQLGRSAFFSTVGFNLGGHILSFQDMENGVLRGNRKAPYAHSKPFAPEDARMSLVLPKLDNRIHFALNCGARSCPEIRDFTSYSLQEELRIAAQEFCSDDKNLSIKGSTLQLSKILQWYIEDFGGNATESSKILVGYCRGSKKMSLRELVGSGNFKVKYNNYDWTSDASEFDPFSTVGVKADSSRFL